MLILLLAAITGVIAGHPLASTGWWHAVAYGLPPLQEGRVWTFVTGAFFAATAADLVLIVVSTGVFPACANGGFGLAGPLRWFSAARSAAV